MEWIQYVILSILTLAFVRILQKQTLQKQAIDPLSYSIIFQGITFVVALIYGAIVGLKFDQFTNIIPNLVFMVLSYSIATALVFYAYQKEEMSIVSVILSSSTIFTVLTSAIFLGHEVSLMKLFGILMIVGGIVLVSLDKNNKFTFSKGTLYALCAAILSGSAFTNDAFILSENRDIPTYLVISFFLPSAILSLIFFKQLKSTIQNFGAIDTFKTILMSFLYFISVIAAYLALQTSNHVPSVSPLLQLATPVTVILSIFILKEKRNIVHKIAGSIVALIGAYIILS